MGFLKNLFKKHAEPEFTAVKGEAFTLENQNGRIEDPAKSDLAEYLQCLFSDPDQFVTLTQPKAVNGIRFMQACLVNGEPVVQLGLEEGGKTRLVEKTCASNAECEAIFYLFYDYSSVKDVRDYTPVQF